MQISSTLCVQFLGPNCSKTSNSYTKKQKSSIFTSFHEVFKFPLLSTSEIFIIHTDQTAYYLINLPTYLFLIQLIISQLYTTFYRLTTTLHLIFHLVTCTYPTLLLDAKLQALTLYLSFLHTFFVAYIFYTKS